MEPVVTLNGVQLHPPALDGTGYELDEDGLQGWYGSPKPKNTFTPRTAYAGSWWSPLAEEDVRVIAVSGTLAQADSLGLLAVQQQLAAICPDPSQLYELRVVDDFGTLIANVQRSDAVLVKPNAPNSTAFSLSLTAPDPLKYNPNVVSANTLLAEAVGGLDWSTGGGLPWSPTATLDWGTFISDGTTGLVNRGTAPSWPVFTVSGPSDIGSLAGFSITDMDTGSVIAYSGLLGIGDVLVIDTNPATRSVTLNGFSDVWSGLTTSQWFQVPAGGQVRLQFQGSTGSTTPLLVASAMDAYF
jgi:hypothetical protein